jgi:hypothetical protein
VVFSLDGAYILMANEGYREAMVGNFSLYDCHGERQHTLYLGEAPEYGKACFKERFEREIHRIKARYPDALYLGIADGALPCEYLCDNCCANFGVAAKTVRAESL